MKPKKNKDYFKKEGSQDLTLKKVRLKKLIKIQIYLILLTI